jgi:DNA-binding transcriptional LysR family regulator
MTLLCAAKSEWPEPVPMKRLDPAHEVYTSWCADLQQWHKRTFGTDEEPQVQLELMSQIRVFIAQTGGWAIVPYSVADALREAPDLRIYRPDFAIPDRRLYIQCSRKTLNSVPVSRFLECLRQVMQERKIPGLLL